MPSLAVSDHVAPTDAEYPGGVYRVVGTSDGTVTLLRVADGDGCRVHTGELLTVDADGVERFEPTDPPAPTRSLGARAASTVEMGYWTLRAFGQRLRAHPLATAPLVALVAVGLVGDSVAPPPLPDPVFGVLLLLGSLGLAYVGGGHL